MDLVINNDSTKKVENGYETSDEEDGGKPKIVSVTNFIANRISIKHPNLLQIIETSDALATVDNFDFPPVKNIYRVFQDGTSFVYINDFNSIRTKTIEVGKSYLPAYITSKKSERSTKYVKRGFNIKFVSSLTCYFMKQKNCIAPDCRVHRGMY